jgi:hypothetical protein
VEFQIFIAYPPDRDGRVVELNDRHDGTVDIPAEIYRDQGQTMITLFSRTDGPAWTYPLADFVAGIEAAVAALDAPAADT